MVATVCRTDSLSSGATPTALPDQLQTIADDREPVQSFLESFEGESGKLSGHVDDSTTPQTPRMRVGVGTSIITGRPVTVGQLRCQAAFDKRLQALVYGGERDSRYGGPDRLEHLIGSGVRGGAREVPVHGRPLLGVAVVRPLQRMTEAGVGGLRRKVHEDEAFQLR
jgi:hypothetical protein